MKKKEAEAVAFLIMIGIFLYPFFWLYERVGWSGIGIISALLVGAVIFWHIQSTKKEQQRFDKLSLYVLQNQMHPNEAKKIYAPLLKSNYYRAALLRNLQIIQESIYIALSSKKRQTAESRLNTLIERYQEIRNEQAHLVSPKVMEIITRTVKQAEHEFQTKLYVNLATGHIEKAGTLKTTKSKSKYFQLAKDVLTEGLKTGLGDASELNRILVKVHRAEQELAESDVRKKDN